MESNLKMPAARETELAECLGGSIPEEELSRSLWELFFEAAEKYSGRAALASLWEEDLSADRVQDQAGVRWTYEVLLQRATSLGRWLESQGLRSGHTLAAFLWNSAEWAVFLWACAKLKVTFVPLDPRCLSSGPDVEYFLSTTKPSALVVQDSEAAEQVDSLLRQTSLSQPKVKICVEWKTKVGGWVTRQVMEKDARALVLDDIARPQQQIGATGSSCQTVCVEAAVSLEKLSAPPAQSGNGTGTGTDTAWAGEPTATEPINCESAERQTVESIRPAVIVFTSGTTSRPKGCPHTAQNLWASTTMYDPDPEPVVDRWLVHTPVSHIFAVNNCIRAWRRGDSVVFPSKSFDVAATTRALREEDCTYMSAVPTLLKALLASPEWRGREELQLRYVTLGGTMIREKDIRLCQVEFGAKAAIQAFGMSEGAPVVSWRRPDPMLENGWHAGVGKALPGCNIRICEKDGTKVLRRGEVGELHMGGPTVISSYLHGASAESFYRDDAGSWLRTGDQAMIDSDGVLHMMGRFKDLIIRGGENIAPAKIEAALSDIPGCMAQVVGIPDEVAGELPVAVVMPLRPVDKTDVAEKAHSLGPIYSLNKVLFLEELGLQSFPMTASGKVRKNELRRLVTQFLGITDTPSVASATTATQSEKSDLSDSASGLGEDETASKEAEISEVLLAIWEELIGLRPDPDSDIKTYCDSITGLRYCDRVLNKLGCRLHLQDIAAYQTLRSQATLISSRVAAWPPAGSLLLEPTPQTSLENVSTVVADLGNLGDLGDPAPAPAPAVSHSPSPYLTSFSSEAIFTPRASHNPTTQDYLSYGHPVIQSLGLPSASVKDVLPIKEILHRFAAQQRLQSYAHRLAFKAKATTPCILRAALVKVITARPLFRTALAALPDGTPFHVVLKPIDQLFDQIVTEIAVETEQDCTNFLQADGAEEFSSALTTQAIIVSVMSTGETYLRLTTSHTIFDALSITPFHNDLDKLLREPTWMPPPMADFKMFSELYATNSRNTIAQANVSYNVGRLRGISRFQASLFPRQRAPGWMISNDSCSPLFEAREQVRHSLWSNCEVQKHSHRFPRVSRIVSLPGILAVQDRGIDPAIVVKAAVALLNISATGENMAIFNTIDAARSWPFVQPWLASALPAPMSADGPWIEFVLNLVELPFAGNRKKKGVNVGDWLLKLAQEETELEKHAHAPWRQVISGLGEEGPVAADASFRQTLVWDVSLKLLNLVSDYRRLVPVGRYDWADCGLFWNACMLDASNVFLVASWDTAQLNSDQVEGLIDGLADILRRLTKRENWGRTVVEILRENEEWNEKSNIIGEGY